ncbi:uncharacterized protein LOC112127776 [Cimex lectularius]|uniref:Uncharacterized protein n=1 Tax=Cimex lectularius TaxID=79782 RepID=A0A8I6TKY5_CIMLE|nr:uncharacterized protein LOC112127776 [Cimex lectularius]
MIKYYPTISPLGFNYKFLCSIEGGNRFNFDSQCNACDHEFKENFTDHQGMILRPGAPSMRIPRNQGTFILESRLKKEPGNEVGQFENGSVETRCRKASGNPKPFSVSDYQD